MTAHSALLLTSCQHDLLHAEGGAWDLVHETVTCNNVISNLTKLTNHARLAGLPIIHSPVGIDYDALDLTTMEPVSPIQALIVERRLFAAGSTGAGFIAEVAPKPGDVVLEPRQGFSSFWANDIKTRLEAMGVKHLYLAGMLSHGCIESHARDAAENGYRASVVSDAIGAAGKPLLQASLAILELHAHEVLTTDAAATRWQLATAS